MIAQTLSRNLNPVEDVENEILQRCKNKDTQAFGYFVQKYQSSVFHTIFRMIGNYQEAADLTQDVFIKAFRAIPNFRGDSSFRTWIYRIAINLCISQRRKYAINTVSRAFSINASLSTKQGEIEIEPVSQASKDPVQILIQKETMIEIEKAIQSLAEDFRAVILLREIEGLSYEEIAEILEIPKGTVRSRLHRARAELQGKLQELL